MSQINFELVRDTYSRDMGTFGKLSVLMDPPTGRVLVASDRFDVDDLVALSPGQTITKVSPGDPIPILGPAEKLFECETVERPWCQNEPNISCIPEGVYRLERRRYYRGNYDAMEICDVPGRSLILIHIANTMLDVEGCVGVGDRRGFILSQWAVLNSKDTFHRLMKLLTDQDPALGSITIRQHIPDMVRFRDGSG